MTIHLSVLLTGFVVFFCCLVAHILLWRIGHPRNHALALLGVFLGLGGALLALLWLLCPVCSMLDLFALVLLHISLSCVYIQIYPASQADSPSLKILVLVGRSMPDGMTEAEIQKHFASEDLFTARLRDLLAVGQVRQDGDSLILTSKGLALVVPFLALRKTLGLPAGKG